MGHRLSQQPESKCFHLHGHSWWVELEIIGEVSEDGMVGGLNFTVVKTAWRNYLDGAYDHHMLLNIDDPLIDLIIDQFDHGFEGSKQAAQFCAAWGIQTNPFDPTVENVAKLWGSEAIQLFGSVLKYRIKVQEASTNAATWRSY